MGRHSRFFAVPREGDDRPIDRDTVRRVVATFRPYKRKVSLVGLLIVITSGLGVVNPLLIAWIFNQGLFGEPAGDVPRRGRMPADRTWCMSGWR